MISKTICSLLGLLFLGCVVATGSAASATTYTYTGGTYSSISNYGPSCGTGICATYLNTMKITGSFTTSAPIPSGLSTLTTVTPTSYSFFDGVNTIASSDPNARVAAFQVKTNGSGVITDSSIVVELWQSSTTPHATGNRLDLMVITGGDSAVNNIPCSTGVGTVNGAVDTCLDGQMTFAPDSSTSHVNSSGFGVFTAQAPASPVPTLSEWAATLLGLTLSGLGLVTVRRLRTA